jgi:hypothetical protein
MTSPPFRLVVQGISSVPSFKNSKMLARGRLITDPKKQKWMDRCIQSFLSQLCSGFRTTAIETQTALCPPCWIASCMPFDDSVKHIKRIEVTVVKVPKGEEGAEIIVRQMQ